MWNLLNFLNNESINSILLDSFNDLGTTSIILQRTLSAKTFEWFVFS